MNIKKVTKIISIILVVMTILSAFSMVFATGPSVPQPSNPSGATKVNDLAGGVMYVIQIIAFTAAFIMLVFLGIKFITASPEGKAEIKKSAVIYIVGAILLFAAGGVLALVQQFASNV